MSRRSSRTPAATATALPASVRRGIASLALFDPATVARMLPPGGTEPLEAQIEKAITVNSLSAELLLARFFDSALLGSYCERWLAKSGKGSAATLAARIAREWAKPSFGVDGAEPSLGAGEAPVSAGAHDEGAPAAAHPAPARAKRKRGEAQNSAQLTD
ncbi:hypothetical protein KFE25_002868 [Diacronema lutheri]|uniref:Uncharacterized protein n=1 Tax=Diacronema lutheri TaxID=2081491 RepID=A0A8J6CBZ2_DIALT|nr:hypothetical protein KFE25_002868 [Diacronema lutheri]